MNALYSLTDSWFLYIQGVLRCLMSLASPCIYQNQKYCELNRAAAKKEAVSLGMTWANLVKLDTSNFLGWGSSSLFLCRMIPCPLSLQEWREFLGPFLWECWKTDVSHTDTIHSVGFILNTMKKQWVIFPARVLASVPNTTDLLLSNFMEDFLKPKSNTSKSTVYDIWGKSIQFFRCDNFSNIIRAVPDSNLCNVVWRQQQYVIWSKKEVIALCAWNWSSLEQLNALEFLIIFSQNGHW